MAGVCTGPGPCDTTSFGAGNNWVNKVGGLPLYIRAIAKALQRSGHSESSAIATAVATVKRWAAGGGNVSAETRARAAAAVAEWEAKKAASHSTSVPAGERQTVDLAGAWDPSKHPRAPKGSANGGKFASGSGGQQGTQTPTDVAAQVKDFQKRHGLAQTGQFDAGTRAAITAKSAGGAGGGGGGKKGAGAAGAATAKYLKALAKAKKAKLAAAKHAAAGKKHAALTAARNSRKQQTLAKAHARSIATAVNGLSTADRYAYKQNAPKPPAGYTWDSKFRLKPVAAGNAAATAAALQIAHR